MAASDTTWELGAEDFESWRRLVEAWSQYGARLFDYHDFGFPARELRAHAAEVLSDLARARDASPSREARLWPAAPAARERILESTRPWNAGKSLGYLAGASFLIQRLRPGFPADRVRPALLAKTCYECVQDILDDLVDRGNLSYPAAQDLYEEVFASLTDGVDLGDLGEGIREVVPAACAPALDRLAEVVGGFREVSRDAANRQALEEFERLNDWVVAGQPLTALLKEPHRDLRRARSVAATLDAPAPDLSWQERWGGHISWPLQHSLLDDAFASEPLSARDLDAHRDMWFYLHAVLTNLNHLAAAREDLEQGIVNVALLSLRERELLGGQGPAEVAELTLADHEALFARSAELSRRAIERGGDGYDDPRHFLPTIAVLVGVVALASKIGRDDAMIHGYMRWLAPAIREAVRGP